jgi:hypothetical protein
MRLLFNTIMLEINRWTKDKILVSFSQAHVQLFEHAGHTLGKAEKY